jgi:putative membrane protein
MHDFLWGGGMWIFPLVMIVGMLAMAFLICGRGAGRFCGHTVHGGRGGLRGEDSVEILKRRYANGEITKEEFERIRKDLVESAA